MFLHSERIPHNIRIHMDNTFYNCFHRGRQLQDGPSRPMTEAENQVSPVMLRRTGRSELLGFHVDDPDLEICCLWLRCYAELTGLARSRWLEGQPDSIASGERFYGIRGRSRSVSLNARRSRYRETCLSLGIQQGHASSRFEFPETLTYFHPECSPTCT